MKRWVLRFGGGRLSDVRVGVRLGDLGKALRRVSMGTRALVVSQSPVARRYAGVLTRGLALSGFRVRLALMADGEGAKNLSTVARLYKEALKAGLDRRSVVVALGGGVVGDVAGFVAATYKRGVPFVNCPTTLLSMVDASLGGKTGVDLPEGKNLVGTLWQPRIVWMDVSTLSTLPRREWRTGLAEVIKYGLISDPSILSRLEKTPLTLSPRHAFWARLVAESAAIKARVVTRDETETKGLREILNLGHTFGHAIEAVSGYTDYTHGEAISIGMCAAARLAVKMGLYSDGARHRLERLLLRWGLPIRARRPLPRQKILGAMAHDKKNTAGRWRLVLPVGPGKVRVVANPSARLLSPTLEEVISSG